MRQSTESSFPNSPQKFGSLKSTIIFLDTSEDPADNGDRDKKLGVGDGTHGGWLQDFDKEAGIGEYVDGFQGKSYSAYCLMEPDNWILRYHTEDGRKGKDNVWAIRGVVDHENKHAERKHRSTMWIDQCKEQNWAFSADAFWIKRLGATIDHKELWVNKAGFLVMPYTGGDLSAGPKVRAALMFNVSKNGGYVTDGVKAGQLWHVLHLSLGAGAGSTTSATDSGCGSVFKWQLTLRGDVLYNFAGELANLAMGPLPEITGGRRLTGIHFLHVPSAIGPAPEHEQDAKSNQPILPIVPNKGIWVYVQQPIEYYPVRPPYDTPATYPARPAGYTTAPAATTQAGYVGDGFATAVVEGYTTTIDVPEDLTANWGINIAVDFLTPAAGWGGQNVELQFDTLVTALGAAPAGAVTRSLSDVLSVATYATNGQASRAMFFIPYADLTGKAGGKISATLYRRGDRDTYAGTLCVLGIFTAYGPEITRLQ